MTGASEENTSEEIYYDSNIMEIEHTTQNETLQNEPNGNPVIEEGFKIADDLKLYLSLQAYLLS